jgi:hypothetical protein
MLRFLTKPSKLATILTTVVLLTFSFGCTQKQDQTSTNTGSQTPSQPPTDTGSQTPSQPPTDTGSQTPPESERPIPGTNALELMKLKQVQDELGLTEQQIEELKQVEGGVNRTPDSSERDPGAQQEGQTGRDKVTQILTEEQLQRFSQILLQVYGVSLMPEADVTEALSITPEQNEKLNELRAKNKEKLRNSLERPSSNDPEVCKQVWANNYQKIMDAAKDSNLKIYSILKEDQVKTLEATKGEKFELDLTKAPPLCQ